ncbi:AMP-binding protein [Fluviispira multicolorata]|uniref:Long-chain-fatty-acid--CoA ligase n=1 Tax=Fluviispira multicolorata TaxID=2654512 RepID=A0A833N747_9BACT|nr:AMP-binding protein [Fluviispira multicolorata]KAB8031810.1 AMP-binding protein [Fluviispira multicolorata]
MSGSVFECVERPWHDHYGHGTNCELEKFEYNNLAEMVSKNSEKWKNRIAYRMMLPNGMDKSLTFAETDTFSNAFAVYLREELHLKSGDRVAIQLPNCLAYPIVVFGCFKAGVAIVNANPLYTAHEMQHQFLDSGAKALVIIDMFADKLKQVIPNTKIEKVIIVSVADLFAPIKKILVKSVLKYVRKQIPNCEVHAIPFEESLNIGKKVLRENKIDVINYWINVTLDDICALQYTGGTTGVSKGAMLTHKNIIANMYQIIEMGKSKITNGQEVLLTVLPLYHIFAFTVNLITFFKVGGVSVLIPNPRPLLNIKKAFEKANITWISGVNTLFNGLLNEKWFSENPPKHLKASIAGGAALHKAVSERWNKVTNTSVVEGYGLTETSPVVTFNPINGIVKSDTVGVPVPGTDVVLISEEGKVVSVGEVGEIAVKGPQVMVGYWQRPEETSKVLKDGWMLTGDIAVMDSDGYIKIVDRKKDMILVSGFNVYPNEVEDCIAKLHGVGEVAVIGIPNERTSEAVKAFIVKKDSALTEQQVIEHCRKYITSYKVPKHVEFRSELPKSPIGKILRKNLRTEELSKPHNE